MAIIEAIIGFGFRGWNEMAFVGYSTVLPTTAHARELPRSPAFCGHSRIERGWGRGDSGRVAGVRVRNEMKTPSTGSA